MEKPQAQTWPLGAIHLRLTSLDVTSIAVEVYDRTCRVDFNSPGFCVVHVGSDLDSVACRQLMVDLKLAMATIHESATSKTLVYLSAARFDQQETTRPHLDGGPDECFLMLGYEPSAVDSELEISDYAKCAWDMGISPKDYMAQHNPMFQSGYDLLRPYTTRVSRFSNTDYYIVCINNSSATFSESQPAWQGTLHTAKILTPNESERRVINSTMIASVPTGTPDTVSAGALNQFVTTSTVRRRGYDKRHLADDR